MAYQLQLIAIWVACFRVGHFFVLIYEFAEQGIFLFIFYTFQNSGAVVDNSCVFIKRKFFIHFSSGKMTRRTVFNKDGFDLFIKSDSYRINFINTLNFILLFFCGIFPSILKIAGLYQQKTR